MEEFFHCNLFFRNSSVDSKSSNPSGQDSLRKHRVSFFIYYLVELNVYYTYIRVDAFFTCIQECFDLHPLLNYDKCYYMARFDKELNVYILTVEENNVIIQIVAGCKLQKLEPASSIERRVDSTRVDADQLIDELIKGTDFQIDDSAESKFLGIVLSRFKM